MSSVVSVAGSVASSVAAQALLQALCCSGTRWLSSMSSVVSVACGQPHTLVGSVAGSVAGSAAAQALLQDLLLMYQVAE